MAASSCRVAQRSVDRGHGPHLRPQEVPFRGRPKEARLEGTGNATRALAAGLLSSPNSCRE